MDASSLAPARRRLWLRGAADFFFLQNRGYPRDSALEWVGNRYGLNRLERQLLGRGVFGQEVALRRKSKKIRGDEWRGQWLVVDGHNVQITVESAVLERPLLLANDGALRDLAGLSGSFRVSEASEWAMAALFRFLDVFRPRRVLFLFDEPMSRSGWLAARYRGELARLGLKGEARTAPVPEREIPYERCVAAGSDREVLDACSKWLDLARRVVEFSALPNLSLVDFTPFDYVMASMRSFVSHDD